MDGFPERILPSYAAELAMTIDTLLDELTRNRPAALVVELKFFRDD